MEKVTIFKEIPLQIPYEAIFRRLGFLTGKTAVSATQRRLLESLAEEGVEYINLKGAARRIAIEKRPPDIVTAGAAARFASLNLYRFLKDCDEALFIAATAGKKITGAIRRESRGKDVRKAVVWDALASEMVDGALGWLMRYYEHPLRREQKALTRNRYSCGYGDLLLKEQQKFYRLLKLKRIGIVMSRAYILSPEKSVTAVAGIKESR